jgi:hypothetical protein
MMKDQVFRGLEELSGRIRCAVTAVDGLHRFKRAFRYFGWAEFVRTNWFDGGYAPPNPAPLAAAGVRGEHLGMSRRADGSVSEGKIGAMSRKV